MSDVDAMVGWLREVWDADEQAARGATPGPWAASGHSLITIEDMVEDIEFADIPRRDAAHVARHDPADTLARIQAERAILTEYESAVRFYVRNKEFPAGEAHGLLTAVRALASGYRHRAGWQQGWVP